MVRTALRVRLPGAKRMINERVAENLPPNNMFFGVSLTRGVCSQSLGKLL